METIFLFSGVYFPLARIDEFWLFSSEFSILSLTRDLYINGEMLLSIIIIIFGFIFPLIKIISKVFNTKFAEIVSQITNKPPPDTTSAGTVTTESGALTPDQIRSGMANSGTYASSYAADGTGEGTAGTISAAATVARQVWHVCTAASTITE